MLDRLRLLPVLMLCALLLLGYKATDLVAGVTSAEANEPAPAAEPAKEAHAAEGAHGETPAATTTEKPIDISTQQQMSQAEIAVLESLATRRDEIEKRSKELDTREQLLAAAESRVQDRIEELKGLEKKIAEQLGQADQQSDQQLAGVVKMYEGMKPKEAARIFERLDMAVLVDLVKRMDPRKMSMVLAAMDPVTAQELTVELATNHLAEQPQDQSKAKAQQAKVEQKPAPVAVPTAAPIAAPAPAAALPDAKGAETPPA